MGEYYPDQDEDYDERVAAYYNDAPPFWRRPIVLGALATIAAFCAVVWFAYNKGVDQGARRLPPLVQADPGPDKVLPDQPGGMEVPHRDRLIYSQLSGKPEKEGVEQLLPPPEEPVEVPKAETPAQGVPAIVTGAGPNAPQARDGTKTGQEPDAHGIAAEQKRGEAVETAQASDEEPADEAAQEPEKEQPKPIDKAARPAAKVVEARPLAGMSPTPSPGAAPMSTGGPIPLAPAPEPSPYQYQPVSRGPVASAPIAPAPVRSAPGYAPASPGIGYSAPSYPSAASGGGGVKAWVNPDTGAVVPSGAGSSAGTASYGSGAPAYNPGRMAALEPASPGPAAGGAAGSYYIQLGSVRDQAQAQSEWARLSRRAPEVLGSQRPIAKRADLGAKGVYYRLQAGPYADRTSAIRACEQVRSHGQGCIVVGQ